MNNINNNWVDFPTDSNKIVRFHNRIKLKDLFTLTDECMRKYDIPKIVIEDERYKDIPEFWTFCKFDKSDKVFIKERRYIISLYGRIYDLKRKRMVSQHDSSAVTSNGGRYKYVNIVFADSIRKTISVHRLVALSFLKKKKHKDVVDHIDENPTNNCIWNLEWTDKSGNANKHNMFVERERTGKAVDTVWKYEELVAICKMMAQGHKATYIYNEMKKITNNNPKIQYERIRTLYKHIMKRGDFHDIAIKCGVKFESNTLKEKGSVEKYKQEVLNQTSNN